MRVGRALGLLRKGVLGGGLLLLTGLTGLAAVNWWAARARDHPVDSPRLEEDDHRQLAEFARLKSRLGDEVWPGLATAEIPVILYNDRYEFLVGVRSAPAGWTAVAGDSVGGEAYFRREKSAGTAFAVRVGGRWTGSMPSREMMNRDLLLRARAELPPVVAQLIPYPLLTLDRGWHSVLVLHEALHAFQAIRAPERFRRAREAYRFEEEYPFDAAGFAAAWDREGAALTRALEASDRAGRCEAVGDFLSIREGRREGAGMSEGTLRFEVELEWLEGLAKYAELRFYELAARRGVGAADYDVGGARWSDDFRRLRTALGNQPGDQRFYLSGMAEARILDRLAPGWKGRAMAESARLDGLLASACSTAPEGRR